MTADTHSRQRVQNTTEQPRHNRYLAQFRVKQCGEHTNNGQCRFNRPFTCFCYHFKSQRRRKCVIEKDGSFSYSPFIYCTKYSPDTGNCPNGDSCKYLHHNFGDTERKFHPRFYKTSICAYEMTRNADQRLMCKYERERGHCPYAHGPADLRSAVMDSKEEMSRSEVITPDTAFPCNLDKERNDVNENPQWRDRMYTLSNYKTQSCKRPGRSCRQGFACPLYHNAKDRRRSPYSHTYRNTPCPQVKGAHSEQEWGDPGLCEAGDRCGYCHTRVEQQFHPDIYKTTKCHDFQQTGNCPRGVFCAFSHQENTGCTNITAVHTSQSLNEISARLKSAPLTDDTANDIIEETGSSLSRTESETSQSADQPPQTKSTPATSSPRVASAGAAPPGHTISYSSVAAAPPPGGSGLTHAPAQPAVIAQNQANESDPPSQASAAAAGSANQTSSFSPVHMSHFGAIGGGRRTVSTSSLSSAGNDSTSAGEGFKSFGTDDESSKPLGTSTKRHSGGSGNCWFASHGLFTSARSTPSPPVTTSVPIRGGQQDPPPNNFLVGSPLFYDNLDPNPGGGSTQGDVSDLSEKFETTSEAGMSDELIPVGPSGGGTHHGSADDPMGPMGMVNPPSTSQPVNIPRHSLLDEDANVFLSNYPGSGGGGGVIGSGGTTMMPDDQSYGGSGGGGYVRSALDGFFSSSLPQSPPSHHGSYPSSFDGGGSSRGNEDLLIAPASTFGAMPGTNSAATAGAPPPLTGLLPIEESQMEEMSLPRLEEMKHAFFAGIQRIDQVMKRRRQEASSPPRFSPAAALCLSCGVAERSVRLLPCRHLVVCESCAMVATAACPSCSAPVHNYATLIINGGN